MMICVLKVARCSLTLTNRLNATVFGFAPDVIFSVDSAAKKAVAISGVTAGIGLVLDFWYQFLYNGATAAKFQVRSHSCALIILFNADLFRLHKVQARDTFGSYFFFCLCCRLPTFFMLISSIALLAFMFFVSFQVWPQAVLVISFLAGILVTLQYLLFGAHRIVLGIRWMFKRIGDISVRLFSRSGEVEPAERRKMMIHQNRLPISTKTRSLEMRERKMKKNIMSSCSEMY
jgi:hypothetical protein